MQYFRLMLCSATQDVCEGYAGGVPWTWPQYSIQFPQCRLWPHLQETSCKPDVMCHKLLSSCWRRLKILLGTEANTLNAVPGQQLNNMITSHAAFTSWVRTLMLTDIPLTLPITFSRSVWMLSSEAPSHVDYLNHQQPWPCEPMREAWWWDMGWYGRVFSALCDLVRNQVSGKCLSQKKMWHYFSTVNYMYSHRWHKKPPSFSRP